MWYHRQFQRVTSIEDCDVSDMTCRSNLKNHFHKSNFNMILQLRFEANQQFLRDWMVEAEMLGLLRLVHMVFIFFIWFFGTKIWSPNTKIIWYRPHFGPVLNIVEHQAEDEWLLLLWERHWCRPHASFQGESKRRNYSIIEMQKFFIDECFNAQAGPCLCSVWKIL